MNGQLSNWLPVKAVVPQRSILGPLFFLVNINNSLKTLPPLFKLFEMGYPFFLS